MKQVEHRQSVVNPANVVLIGVLILWASARGLGELFRFKLPGIFQLNLSQVQILAFPILLLLFWRLKLFRVRVPALVLGLSTLGAVLAVGLSYSHVSTAQHSILIAGFAQDEFEIESRLFRESINGFLSKLNRSGEVKAIRHHSSLTSHHQALEVLKDVSGVEALVWRDRKLVRVSFPEDKGVFFAEKELAPWMEATHMRIVSSVPGFYLSYAPKNDTAQFLANLFSALSYASQGSQQVAELEIGLRNTGAQISAWSSLTHRAYPWWVLGNVLLTNALRDGKYEPGELQCAITAYTKVRESIGFGANPELLAAALNNRSFALYVQGVMEGRKDLRKMAKRGFHVAALTLKQPDPLGAKYHAGKVARSNFRYLKKDASDHWQFARKAKHHSKVKKGARHRKKAH